jgi:hypothetical protein
MSCRTVLQHPAVPWTKQPSKQGHPADVVRRTKTRINTMLSCAATRQLQSQTYYNSAACSDDALQLCVLGAD